jgi:hypothetical protein
MTNRGACRVAFLAVVSLRRQVSVTGRQPERKLTMRQLTLGLVTQKTKAVVLQPEVEKSVVAWMAQMIADIVQEQEPQERSRNDQQTDQQ